MVPQPHQSLFLPSLGFRPQSLLHEYGRVPTPFRQYLFRGQSHPAISRQTRPCKPQSKPAPSLAHQFLLVFVVPLPILHPPLLHPPPVPNLLVSTRLSIGDHKNFFGGLKPWGKYKACDESFHFTLPSGSHGAALTPGHRKACFLPPAPAPCADLASNIHYVKSGSGAPT